MKRSDAELMQYRMPVGAGPSSNTWPRCEPPACDFTSVRDMPSVFVRVRLHPVRLDWFREAGPAGPGLEFVGRAEERLAGGDVDIETGAVVVPEPVAKRGLGGRVLRHFVLERRKLGLELRVVGLRVGALGQHPRCIIPILIGFWDAMTTSGCELDIAEGARSCRAHPASAATPKTTKVESSVRQQPDDSCLVPLAFYLSLRPASGRVSAKERFLDPRRGPSPVLRLCRRSPGATRIARVASLFRRGHLIVTDRVVRGQAR